MASCFCVLTGKKNIAVSADSVVDVAVGRMAEFDNGQSEGTMDPTNFRSSSSYLRSHYNVAFCTARPKVSSPWSAPFS